MNGVLGMVSILKETELTEEQTNMVDTVSSSGEGLLNILNDVLDLSKVDAGKIELEFIPFNLHKCIEEVAFLFKQQIDQGSINFSVDFTGDAPADFLLGDVNRIKQILINLVSNAIKFTENGEVRIIIDSKDLSSSRSRIHFSVEDNGIGISESFQKELFRAFTQADTSVTRKFGGTGLGLTISAKLATLMNSEIKITSQLGKGSKFSFEVELDHVCKMNLNESLNKGSSELSLKGCRVLLAEDNEVNILVAKKMLSKLDCEVTVAKNGEEAVSFCNESDYDIILMDMQMPILSGIEATLEIRSSKRFKRTPIIALTANALPTDREKCLDAGMDDFISKPVNYRSLQEVLLKSIS